MNLSLSKQILAALLILALGLGLGYYFAPNIVKITNKTDTKKDVNTENDQTITKKFDPQTGKVIEEKIETIQKKDTSTETIKEKTVDKEKTSPQWALKVGAVKDMTNLSKPYPRVGAERRLLGPFWLGGEADITPTAPSGGLYLRLEF